MPFSLFAATPREGGVRYLPFRVTHTPRRRHAAVRHAPCAMLDVMPLFVIFADADAARVRHWITAVTPSFIDAAERFLFVSLSL